MNTMVIKRDGRKVPFSAEKIENAVLRAFRSVDKDVDSYAILKAKNIAEYIAKYCEDEKIEEIDIEKVQDLVENGLMATKRKDVAKAYITYRDERTRVRGGVTDKTLLEYLSGQSEYWNTENSNKDATVVTTMRDYIAGITSTDLARRFLLPRDVCEAHDAGLIHYHDMDYMAQPIHNCELINIEDILQNGTVVNGVKIDPPHRLLTASTITTQVITAVASSSFGGATITLTHLAPFVRKSREIYLREIESEAQSAGIEYTDEQKEKIARQRLAKEVKDAVQTFNYQINSMSTTNGQAPFLSVYMYTDEDPEYAEETAMLIEEFLNQRILGMKNEKGVYVTPAFPKLLYVLDEDNIHEDSKYWYLTKLAAKCTAKRMVPDYISAKKMREYKNGDVYPCIN